MEPPGVRGLRLEGGIRGGYAVAHAQADHEHRFDERAAFFRALVPSMETLSLHRGRLEHDKTDLLPLLREIGPGFASCAVVSAPGGAVTAGGGGAALPLFTESASR